MFGGQYPSSCVMCADFARLFGVYCFLVSCSRIIDVNRSVHSFVRFLSCFLVVFFFFRTWHTYINMFFLVLRFLWDVVFCCCLQTRRRPLIRRGKRKWKKPGTRNAANSRRTGNLYDLLLFTLVLRLLLPSKFHILDEEKVKIGTGRRWTFEW